MQKICKGKKSEIRNANQEKTDQVDFNYRNLDLQYCIISHFHMQFNFETFPW